MKLSAKQLQAALLLVSGSTITATSENIGIARQTVHEWLKDDEFVAHLNSLKRESIEAGRAAIQAAASQAVDTIMDLMKNGQNEVVRLASAKEILVMTGLDKSVAIGSDSAQVLKDEKKEAEMFK